MAVRNARKKRIRDVSSRTERCEDTITPVKAILLFSHGSVLCGAEQNLLEVAATMKEAGDAPIVEVGFLNYSEPLFASAVSACVEQGATSIVIAPWFLIAGKFVVQDLPAAIASVREAYPDVDFSIADVIGFHPAIAEAVIASAGTARDPRDWTFVGDNTRWCRKNPRCPLYGEEGCLARDEATA